MNESPQSPPPAPSPLATPPADLAEFAFSPSAQWTIDPACLGWGTAESLETLRARTQAEIPELLRHRRLPPGRRFFEVARHLLPALVGWATHERRQGGPESRAGLSRRLRVAFEVLGPSYVKLGQIVSSGKGIFPDELTSELKLLRDQVRPEPFEVVRRTVEEDLGRPLDAVFARFDREALAAASIAQVHAARLQTGEEVVVKVQRPTVARLVREDIRAMAWIAPFLVGRIPVSALANPPALVELFAETILEELDFRLEAANMLDLARVFVRADERIIVVPRPHPELVTRRVLVMERLAGFTYDDVAGMRAAGVDTSALLHSLLVTFLEGAVIHGIFHGDLHGGNLFVMPDGKIALFDYGITARMDETRRRAFLRLMMTALTSDLRAHIESYRDLGALPPDVDIRRLIRELKLDRPPKDPTQMSSDELTREIQEVTRALMGYGAKLPKSLMLYVKNMLFIDDAIAHLAPEINIFEQVTRVYGHFVQNHAAQILGDIGFDATANLLDLTNFKATMGLSGDVESLTHEELQKRREIVRERLENS